MALLAFIDRTDDYQIINYICWFKALVFVKFGLIPLFSGFFRFYFCLTTDSSWPGSADREQLSVITLFINNVTGLLAFLIYRCNRNRELRLYAPLFKV